MKKKLVSIAMAGLMAFSLAACGNGGEQNAEAGDLLQQIQDKGTLTVAMEGTWAPGLIMMRTTTWWALTWRWRGRSRRSWAWR